MVNCLCMTTTSARLCLYLKRFYLISSAIAYCISPYASFYAGLSCSTSCEVRTWHILDLIIIVVFRQNPICCILLSYHGMSVYVYASLVDPTKTFCDRSAIFSPSCRSLRKPSSDLFISCSSWLWPTIAKFKIIFQTIWEVQS